MPNFKLRVSRAGQIKVTEVQFGDLTVLVAPQATGKSIFLQLFKLLVEVGADAHNSQQPN